MAPVSLTLRCDSNVDCACGAPTMMLQRAKRERGGYYFIDHSIGIWEEEVKLDPIDLH